MMFELFREQGRSGQEAKAIAISARWPVAPFDKSGLQLAASSPLSQDLLRASIHLVQDQLSELIRLSVRDTSPHLLLNYTLRSGREGHAGHVFRFVLELARMLRDGRADGDMG
jgi:hypothetical protein